MGLAQAQHFVENPLETRARVLGHVEIATASVFSTVPLAGVLLRVEVPSLSVRSAAGGVRPCVAGEVGIHAEPQQ